MERNGRGIIFLCVIVTLILLTGSSMADAGGYAQTGVDKFKHTYSLSGDPANDIASIAEAQEGLGMSDLGYTASWCAAFVNDCAKFAGAEDAIPFVSGRTHFAHELRIEIINKGGHDIATSEAKRGDIAFFDWDSDGRYDHVGICTSNTATIEGNIAYGGNKIYLVRRATISNRGGSVQVVRPNYITNNAPVGNVDILTGAKGYIRVAGWAKDNDTPDQSVTIHVYVGGQAGSGRTPYVISANKYRSDLGGNYGFDEQIIVSETGEQPVYVYALDTAGGHNPILGSSTVTITPNADPDGILDSAVGGVGTITVRGRVYDEDTPDGPVYVHMYVGGMAGSGAPSYSFLAEKGEDFCYFSGTAAVEPYGTQTIYLYAINTEYGNNPLFDTAEVTITKDEEKPVISNIQISDVSAGGYTITCDVSDNAWVKKVAFPTWTLDKENISTADNQDDLFADWENTTVGTYQNGKATYRVKTSDHNYETGVKYATHIYAWDVTGNYTAQEVLVNVPSAITNVQVTDASETGYTVSCDIDPNWGDVMKVCFPTWTVNNGQDDLDPNWMDNSLGTISGNRVTYRVLTNAHNGEKNCYYTTHIYAWKSGWESTHVTQVDFPVLNVYVTDEPVITIDNGTTIGTDATATVSLLTGTKSLYIEFGRITDSGDHDSLSEESETVSTSSYTYTVPGLFMTQPGTYYFRVLTSETEDWLYPDENDANNNWIEKTFTLSATQLPDAPVVETSGTDFIYTPGQKVTITVPGAEAIAISSSVNGYFSGEDVGGSNPTSKDGSSFETELWYIGRFDFHIWAKVNGLWSPYSKVTITCRPPENMLTLPNDLKVIDSQALAGLESVDAVRLPATVETIADDAFSGTNCIVLIPYENAIGEALNDYCIEHGLELMYE